MAIQYQTIVYDNGSPQLASFLADNTVGKELSTPAGTWTITRVEQDTSIPPNPVSGAASTKVTLTMESAPTALESAPSA